MGAPFALDWLDRRPYRDLDCRFVHALRAFSTWPLPEQYDALVHAVPQATDTRLPCFVSENREALRRAGGYERHVARLGTVPTRPQSWHDFFNMVVWAHFPRLRWALNALHVDPEIGPKDPRNGRAPAQNLAATFDETGMLAVSTSRDLLEELRALHFRRAFWERRAELVSTTRFWVVGHGLLEALLEPRPGLSGRCLLLHMPELAADGDELRVRLDALAAGRAEAWRNARSVLDPIPVLAIPGFCDNDSADFYEDPRNIRFEPISRRPASAEP